MLPVTVWSLLLDILDLFAHLFDQHFQLHRILGGLLDTDLDDRVLASRLSSCIRKSRRRPQGPPFSRARRTLGYVGFQPVQLLVHVRFLGQVDQLLLQSALISSISEVLYTGDDALALLLHKLG